MLSMLRSRIRHLNLNILRKLKRIIRYLWGRKEDLRCREFWLIIQLCRVLYLIMVERSFQPNRGMNCTANLVQKLYKSQADTHSKWFQSKPEHWVVHGSIKKRPAIALQPTGWSIVNSKNSLEEWKRIKSKKVNAGHKQRWEWLLR